ASPTSRAIWHFDNSYVKSRYPTSYRNPWLFERIVRRGARTTVRLTYRLHAPLLTARPFSILLGGSSLVLGYTTAWQATKMHKSLFLICVAALCAAMMSCGKKGDSGFAGDAPDGGLVGFDQGDGAGIHPCDAAQQTSTSVGCEYYAIHMDGAFDADNGCFVAFVANTFSASAHLVVTFAGADLDLSQFAKLPRGSG